MGIVEKVLPLHIEKPVRWKGSQREGEEIHSSLPSHSLFLKKQLIKEKMGGNQLFTLAKYF